VVCATGACCDGKCVDTTTDPKNCDGCGNVCATGACGTTIAAPMTTMPDPSQWKFNGSAQYDATMHSGVLVPAAPNVTGTILYSHPIAVDTFGASFDFRVTSPFMAPYDGMGFMFERTGPTAVGGGSSQLGMGGLDGYGVELDIYDNGRCGDMNANHVGIDWLLSCGADAGTALPTSLFASAPPGAINIADGNWHTIHASLASGAMLLTFDATSLTANGVALPGFTPGGKYYFGFGAACGGLPPNMMQGARMEVRNVAITFPKPRCL
jgi:hypothetical protein